MTTNKKDIILKAASDCFSRFGYDKTTLDDIGRSVNLNKASLYYYYRNKEDIFTAVVLQESEQYIKKLQDKAKKHSTPEDQIINYLIDRLRYYAQVLNLHQLSLETLNRVEPIFDNLYKMVLAQEVEFMAKLLQNGINNNTFFDMDTGKVAGSILTVADSVKFRAMREANVLFASEVDYSKIEGEIKFITQLILKGLKIK